MVGRPPFFHPSKSSTKPMIPIIKITEIKEKISRALFVPKNTNVFRAMYVKTPRIKVPAGSVAIGGDQTGIYPVSSPGGWRIIGRTPEKLFLQENTPPTLLKMGDYVKFVPITRDEFENRMNREKN